MHFVMKMLIAKYGPVVAKRLVKEYQDSQKRRGKEPKKSDLIKKITSLL